MRLPSVSFTSPGIVAKYGLFWIIFGVWTYFYKQNIQDTVFFSLMGVVLIGRSIVMKIKSDKQKTTS